MLNLKKPEIYKRRSYTFLIKNKNGKPISFSLYGKIKFELLSKVIKVMLTEEKDKFLNTKERYCFDKPKSESIQYIQLLKADSGESTFFTTEIEEYTSAEIKEIMEEWLKEAKDFPKGKAKRMIQNAKQNNSYIDDNWLDNSCCNK